MHRTSLRQRAQFNFMTFDWEKVWRRRRQLDWRQQFCRTGVESYINSQIENGAVASIRQWEELYVYIRHHLSSCRMEQRKHSCAHIKQILFIAQQRKGQHGRHKYSFTGHSSGHLILPYMWQSISSSDFRNQTKSKFKSRPKRLEFFPTLDLSVWYNIKLYIMYRIIIIIL